MKISDFFAQIGILVIQYTLTLTYILYMHFELSLVILSHTLIPGSRQVQTGPFEANVRGGAGKQGGGQQRCGHPLTGPQVQRCSPEVLRPGHDLSQCGPG